MERKEELDLFLSRANELVESKYIVADIKIANLLKAIASSETLLAIFKNCLSDFDFNEAKKKYLIKSEYLSADKGEFILPETTRELLAFVFYLLAAFDVQDMNLADFIKKYFYEDGSYSSGYLLFVTSMIKPFVVAVKNVMTSVIDGRIQDPIDAINEEELRKAKEKEKEEKFEKLQKESSLKSYGESLTKLRQILVEDKLNVKKSKIADNKKNDLILIIDMLANVIESYDKDAINYAFTSYKYAIKAHKILFFKRSKQTEKLIKDILNGI